MLEWLLYVLIIVVLWVLVRLFHLLKILLLNKNISWHRKDEIQQRVVWLLVGPIVALLLYVFLFTRFKAYALNGIIAIGGLYAIAFVIALFLPIGDDDNGDGPLDVIGAATEVDIEKNR